VDSDSHPVIRSTPSTHVRASDGRTYLSGEIEMEANKTRCPRCKQPVDKWRRFCPLCSGTTRFGLFCYLATAAVVITGVVVLIFVIAAA